MSDQTTRLIPCVCGKLCIRISGQQSKLETNRNRWNNDMFSVTIIFCDVCGKKIKKNHVVFRCNDISHAVGGWQYCAACAFESYKR